MIPKLFLSKRNLLTLLSKLERAERGESTACALIKSKGPSPDFQQTMDEIMVVAVLDDEYYSAQGRVAGEVHPADTPS